MRFSKQKMLGTTAAMDSISNGKWSEIEKLPLKCYFQFMLDTCPHSYFETCYSLMYFVKLTWNKCVGGRGHYLNQVNKKRNSSFLRLHQRTIPHHHSLTSTTKDWLCRAFIWLFQLPSLCELFLGQSSRRTLQEDWNFVRTFS